MNGLAVGGEPSIDGVAGTRDPYPDVGVSRGGVEPAGAVGAGVLQSVDPDSVAQVRAVGERIVDTVTQQPELLGPVAVVVLFLIGGLLAWRFLRRTPADRFVDVLARQNRVAVLMHPNPDPDAMASAMGVQALAESVDTEAIVHYPGQIRHPENRAFQTVLDCDFDRIERANELGGLPVVLVDHNDPRGFEGAENVEPYAIVDHHPGNGVGEVFTDVRPERGSCSSILAEYLRDRGWSGDVDDERTLTPTLATALLYGIQSDTTSFTRGCTHAEFDAAAYLFPAADPDSLERIANPQIDSETLEVKARAINERGVDGSFLVSDVGGVSNLDALPPAAEELVRLEGVTVAVVVGERDDRLHLSGRSRDDRVHMGRTLQTALETVPDASAGGHARMGGGQAAVPNPPDDRDGAAVLEERLFAAMNGEL